MMTVYNRLLKAIGPRNWWPAETAQEVIFGAILTQNTSWQNVEQALSALKKKRKLSFRAVRDMDRQELAEIIRPARFLNQKARALQEFADHFGKRYRFSIKKMKAREMEPLRDELLGLYRIGPETADSILLYALDKPVFVIDAYTRRIFSRHGMLSEERTYDDFQHLFMEALPPDVGLYNEYHALLVHVGNRFCKPKPQCDRCPLKGLRHT